MELVFQGDRKTMKQPSRLALRIKGIESLRIFESGIEEDLMQTVGELVSKSGSMTARVISPSGAALPGIPKAHFFDPVFCAMVRWSGMAAGTGGTANSRR